MKPVFTQNVFFKAISSLLLCICSLAAFAQPEYDFRNPSLKTGSPLQINAVYLFTNVKPGIDAQVTIIDLTGGVTLSDLDEPTTGYPEAFQPGINVPAGASGYAEFRVRFVVSGSGTAATQSVVNVSCIDIDGNSDYDGLGNRLQEFDQVNMGYGSYYSAWLGVNELLLTTSGSWVNGCNMAGLEYPGRDTTAKQVMFTTTNTSLSSFTIRVGANNYSTINTTRQRSVYFKSFVYPNPLLSASCLLSFDGKRADNKTELNWELGNCQLLDKAVIERSADGRNFTPIGEVWSDRSASGTVKGKYYDSYNTSGNIYYRLKLVYAAGTTEYSSVLRFRSEKTGDNTLKIYPNAIASQTTIDIVSDSKQNASFQLTDYNGRVVFQKALQLQAGANVIPVTGLGSLTAGQYVATVRLNGSMLSQKVFKQ
jgi:hypothetical protein